MIENDGLIIEISGKSVFENVPIAGTFKGKYAAYQAYMFYLKNLSEDVEVYKNGEPFTFEEFRILAEQQSARHEVAVVKHEAGAGLILA